MSDTRPLGIFDSGLGGLTVAREIIKLMPAESTVYFGDTGRVPYGTRSESTIVKYARQDEAFLLKHNAKAVIAACGTVSSVAAFTGEELPVPFFEVVSCAAASAVKATKNGKIGVIGTPATVKSGSHAKKIRQADNNIKVFASACPMFVPLVENGWISKDDAVVRETAKRYLSPLQDANVDTLILGCTHYPVLWDVIADIMGKDVTLINSGYAVALAVKDYLSGHNMCSDASFGQHSYYVSDGTENFSKQAAPLLGTEKIVAEQVEL